MLRECAEISGCHLLPSVQLIESLESCRGSALGSLSCKWPCWMGEQPSHGSVASEHFTKANRSQLQRWVTKARVLTMDNVRMDRSYLPLSLSLNSKCLTLHQVNFKCKSRCFFSLTAVTARCGFFFFLHFTYDLHANRGASFLSISD